MNRSTIKAASRLTLCLMTAGAAAQAQRFLPDDPIWQDPDNIAVPQPQRRSISKVWDFTEKTFILPRTSEPSKAVNINTLGEVPDSCWFTNRIGIREMSREELMRGPNTGPGPALSGSLKVKAMKTEGITPGFRFVDARGDLYFVKFDTEALPEMATAAEVISTKFLHAIGYHVPQNYLIYLDPGLLEIDPEAMVTGDDGRLRPMRPSDLKAALYKASKRNDGTIQVVASLALKGKPLGPFEFYGTRSDDPNDIFAHQDRRELRGYRIFSAWLNHNDSDAANTLDTFVTENGAGFVRHYLIDFGTTLGSGGVHPHYHQDGHEHFFDDQAKTLKSALTLGIADRDWQRIDFPKHPTIGRFEAENFQPQDWKPDYPNPAFDRMLPEDAFWAVRILSRFSDERIRWIVETGQISDSQAEEYLIRTLIRRRDKILDHYLRQINPLSGFRLETGRSGLELTFSNLGAGHGLAQPESYEYRWFRYDNLSAELTPLDEPGQVRRERIGLPSEASPYQMVRIRTLGSGVASWEEPVEVYIRRAPEDMVVGVDQAPRSQSQ